MDVANKQDSLASRIRSRGHRREANYFYLADGRFTRDLREREVPDGSPVLINILLGHSMSSR